MKPKIDLNSPIYQAAIELLHQQVEKALITPQTVESSVIPIYAVLTKKAHKMPNTKPEQIGSGVIVNIKDQYFIFSATHVFLEFDGIGLMTGDCCGGLVQQVAGERFTSGIQNSLKEKQIDASVFHIQSEISESLKNVAISLEDFDFDDFDDSKPVCMASGFRIKKSNTVWNLISSKRECFPTVELNLEDYKKLKIDPETFIVLSYENQVLVDGLWQTSPIPKGISGGAIMKVIGTNCNPNYKNTRQPKQLLTAITIEQHREKGNKPGILIGTRINAYLGLIHKFLPELLTDFIKTQNTK